MHFYLREEVRAAEPVVPCRQLSSLFWAEAGLGQVLASQVAAQTEGHSRDYLCPAGCEGLPSSSLYPVVHAEEQTVKGEESGLGAFLGAGGVGG